MLVLTRTPGKAVLIGGNIVVRVIECRNGRVRLGIEAPSNVSIHRQEVVEAIGNGGAIAHGSGPDGPGAT